jgi:hypothetical protein
MSHPDFRGDSFFFKYFDIKLIASKYLLPKKRLLYYFLVSK